LSVVAPLQSSAACEGTRSLFAPTTTSAPAAPSRPVHRRRCCQPQQKSVFRASDFFSVSFPYMRKDRHPENTSQSGSTPDYHRDPPEEDAPPSLMAYPSLDTLQQRLDSFENRFADQNQQDDGPLLPRIARVAPMSATAESTRDRQLPAPINSGFSGAEVAATARVTATATTGTVSAPASVAAATATGAGSFGTATGAGSFGTATNAAARSAPAGAARSVGVRATVWDTPHSAANTAATSNTSTYASSRGRLIPNNYTRSIENTNYQQYLVYAASTSHHNYCKVDYNNTPAMSAHVGGSYFDTASSSSSANSSAETLAACSDLNPEAPAFFPRMYRDAEMTDVSAPFKVAKRSEQHTSVRRNEDMVTGCNRCDEDEGMDVDV
ncbi:hypothetical protein ACI65C_006349, partial [Semiaphis heraclei]